MSRGFRQATCDTEEFVADVCLPAFGCCRPMVCCPRGIMSDVLLMAAFQFGNPIQVFV
jgi:hypothetical protein